MHNLVIIFYFLFILNISAEFVLRPKYPPSLIDTLETSPLHPLVLRCTTDNSEANQKWVFRGNDLKETHGKLTIEGTDSILTVPSFDPKLHAGVYECYEGQLTASVRVDSDVGPPLPKGFRPCEQVETNTCIRGSCGVDPLNNIVCICPFGWSGSKCDTPQGQVKLRPDRNTDCLICGILFGCITVFSIIFVTYHFCPVSQCKSKESDMERGPSLIQPERKVDEEESP